MDKYEQIDKILNDMNDYCYCEVYHDCPFEGREAHECNRCKAEAIYNANYRKVADDEIVIKKSEYEELQVGNDYHYGCCEGQKNMEAYYENFVLPQVKQETAREILQELFDYFKKDVDTLWIKVVELAKKYGIELED